jgi:hypothetical protein
MKHIIQELFRRYVLIPIGLVASPARAGIPVMLSSCFSAW